MRVRRKATAPFDQYAVYSWRDRRASRLDALPPYIYPSCLKFARRDNAFVSFFFTTGDSSRSPRERSLVNHARLTRDGVNQNEARGPEEMRFDAQWSEVLRADVEGRRQSRRARDIVREVPPYRPGAVESYVDELRARTV